MPRESAGTPGRVLGVAVGAPGALVPKSAPGASVATKRVKVYFPLHCPEKPPRANAAPAGPPRARWGGRGERGGCEAVAPRSPSSPGKPGAEPAEAPRPSAAGILAESVASSCVSFWPSVPVFPSRIPVSGFPFPLSPASLLPHPDFPPFLPPSPLPHPQFWTGGCSPKWAPGPNRPYH